MRFKLHSRARHVSATVDFVSGDAIVRYDGREALESAAINAVEAAGFHAEAQREADVNRR